VPCARLSWPSRQLLSARKFTASYHIVLKSNFLVAVLPETKAKVSLDYVI